MTQKEKKDIIISLKKEIKTQKPIILESIKCDTMTDVELAYYKRGIEDGMKLFIDILSDEQ